VRIFLSQELLKQTDAVEREEAAADHTSVPALAARRKEERKALELGLTKMKETALHINERLREGEDRAVSGWVSG
jgi:hypothetical protein